MALINCPECKNEISSSATSCPHCGYPIDPIETESTKLSEKVPEPKDKNNKSAKKALKIIIIVIVLIGIVTGAYFIATKNERNYKKAVGLYNSGNYSESLEVFNKIIDYNDSSDYIKKCKFEVSVNGQFLRALATGLEERWKLTDLKSSVDSTSKDWENYIKAEYDKVSNFSDMNFENEDLGKLAKEYVKLLNDAKGVIKYVDRNSESFWNEYNPINEDRCIILKKISDNYTIPVSENNITSLRGLITSGELTLEIRKILETTKFKEKKNDYGWKEYEAIVKNTSSTEFSWFCFNINLIGKDGTVIETTHASTDNWKVGNKHKFRFSTSENFDKIVIDSCSYN